MQSLTFVSHCALAYTIDLSYIYVVCMWIYVFWYFFFTVVVLVFGFFVVYAFVALTSFVNQLIITELFSISCFSRSLG